MPARKPALALPDSLLVRYYRAEEIDFVTAVQTDPPLCVVTLVLARRRKRTDRWVDLGGGIGFVPAPGE